MGEVVAGRHDAYFAGLFEGLVGVPGLFRPWMEMNGAHNPYSGDPVVWRAAWEHLHSLADGVAGLELTWIFCPQAFDPLMVWESYVPARYDWFGLDLYRDVFAGGDPWRVFANAHHKPFCICESGFEQDAIVKAVGGASFDKDGSRTGRSLIEEHRMSLHLHPNTVMYLVWNNIGPIGNDFIDTSAKSLAQYREFAKDPYFKFGS